MSIEQKEFKYEEDKLKDTENWIENQISEIKKDNVEFENKIVDLKKQSKGKYSEELEITEKLYNITHKNLEKYNEAKVTPYFARIDFRERKRTEVESYYIGKFGLGDSRNGEEKIIDWRAPIADLYYSGTAGKVAYKIYSGYVDGELYLKRKFLIQDKKLKDAFDDAINEIILKAQGGSENNLVDEFLRINLEKNVSSKLKDVVATIQKEQNDIIRSEKNSALVVQGSAGSGKTTVALHRLAYLIYKYNKSLSGKDVLVVAPNRIFLDYISDVLPSLGANTVVQETFEDIALKVLGIKSKVYTKDKKLAYIFEDKNEEDKKLVIKTSNFKGSLLFKEMIDKYLKTIEEKDSVVEDIKIAGYVLFDKKEIRRLFCEDMSHLPIDKRKDEIKRYFNLKIKDKIINICDKISFTYEYNIARVKKNMEDGVERRKKLIALYDERDNKRNDIIKNAPVVMDNYFEAWKHTDTAVILDRFFNSKDVYNELAKGKISQSLWKHIKSEFNQNREKKVIDSDDLAAMLYIKFNIEGNDKFNFKHIIIDEAQDYSIFQFSALKNLCSSNSFTIVGDLGQGIYYYKGINDWASINKNVFEDNFNYVALSQSYRSTVEIIEFANEVLKKQDIKLEPAKPVLRHGDKPEVIEFATNKEFVERADEIVERLEKLDKKNIAIIGKTYDECKKINDALRKYSKNKWKVIRENDKSFETTKIVIPSYITKGLEFDCSIIYNCSEDNYKDTELDKKTLYVSLTRALHYEYIFFKGKKSSLIK
ncbi:DNA helicase-2/ATP-dependent DNA helicase PcrA [Clostridium acetobutylicum]|uniref:Superfamily I DNA helicase n=1 Tax=Clostridium acetobutylicum (strain ATCC 824 / DSM 792 / JCM 1419 / IAM 19013 / LMG 5710 / NBRC 13948 / NRRL B-527 / VKM B-1787 / 2291 / W) TaxID=272562 RepID=Q97K93_CLOAB|nr:MULTISPECIES: RNA polymerase recycling motor HelD [Clostridium]AAK79002.1 Superfamily I DNA helicase [Clostridium acetobutylicum ATCC 824]ADZ20077.1 Superfamily I DNA helicase [Clostridium acetobutylicum EA 2018]AEI34341.1 superfamily I DNA/RNA helicase [Clostridium acetobutylicum DSM 1731]AWV81742.1 AAA family ATPase [Clostridium acetobutylicum]MBC2395284.1 AAA family ATPase [Clostridium acetobutylicum]